MDWQIFSLLLQDGVATGAVYVLTAMGLVLVFSVTRVIFVPQGEFVAFGALTMASLEAGAVPATAWLSVGLGAMALVMGLLPRGSGNRRAVPRAGWREGLGLLGLPLLVLASVYLSRPWWHVELLRWALALACTVPLAPILYRLVFQPIASASTLVLLIAAIALHLALVGAGLLMFGAEGSRTQRLLEGNVGGLPIAVPWQTVVVIGISLALIVALYQFFGKTLLGKALKASAICRQGARLVGIRVGRSGATAFTIAALLGVVSGLLIAPTTTVYYESGFLLGLKGFVGAIVGGLVAYPAAAAGALLVGLLESFSSFYASQYKEIIVFALLIPFLLWRSMGHGSHAEEEEERA